MRRLPLLLGLALLAACRPNIAGHSADMAALPLDQADRVWLGAARFTYDDFGGLSTAALETNALPWKLVTAALMLDAHDREGTPVTDSALAARLATFGFIIPTEIANWPAGPPPRAFTRPIGLVAGNIEMGFPASIKIETVNLGCSACHTGVTYDAEGLPRPGVVWLGLPNTSVNFQGFSIALADAIEHELGDPQRLLDAVRALYPETNAREMSTMRDKLIPGFTRRLAELRAAKTALFPFPIGSPGSANGVGGIKRTLGVLPAHAEVTEVGVSSIPDLGNVVLRTSLLADGGVLPKGEVRFRPYSRRELTDAHLDGVGVGIAFFTVGIMGNEPSLAERQIPKAQDVTRFLETYAPPRFPGAIDSTLARRGAELYGRRCDGCHGSYDESRPTARLLVFPNHLVALAEIGTDSARLAVLDTALVRAMRAAPQYDRHEELARTGGYVAPRLAGVWATAPYLHNGSVPTLWHLMHPASRPTQFQVGGHRLDFSLVGIAGSADTAGVWRYPADYVPWSTPVLYDTRQGGQGNGGHEREFRDLSDAELLALIEFLKTL